jgi:hypothetical protein
VADYWLSKTLMDNGSSINILYLDTFWRLQLPESMIESTRCTFHGIVSGRKAFLVGKVTMLVSFDTPQNYRTEKIIFELVNLHSPYHCVLGRPAFAKFMAVSHYAYNLLKIPGPKGVITVHRDFDLAQEYEINGAKLADVITVEETNNTSELAKYSDLVNLDDPALLKKPHLEETPKTLFEPAVLTRQVDLILGDSI